MRVASETWRSIIARDNGICQYCGVDLFATFSSYWSATVDHVHAVATGGTDDAINLVACCPACNSMLCRSGHLQTILERKAFVAARRAQEQAGYEAWLREHRGLAV
ncbi:HNH endonuclease [Rhodanobacter koreensis]